MTTQLNSVETLTSSNYKKWKQDVEIKPAEPTTTSTADEKAKFEKWMKANKLSLMIMKRSISDHIIGVIKDNGNAKDFLSAIGQKFLESDKVKIGSLIDSLSTIKYDLVGSVRDHIMKLVSVATKLNNLGVTITNNFLVHQSLRKGGPKFHKRKHDQSHHPGGNSGNTKKPDVNQGQSHNPLGPQAIVKKETKCWDCKLVGHKKSGCPLKKKSDNLLAFDLVSRRKPKEDEASVVVVPSMRRKLVLVSLLDKAGYSFQQNNGIIKIFYDSHAIVDAFLSYGLYRLNVLNETFSAMHVENIAHKRFVMSKTSYLLCHRRLGHISKERIEPLVKENILPVLDPKDFETCVDCVKGKMTKLGKSIKIMRSDRGGEYYEKYDESGQCMGPFALFLQEYGIVAQYTMSGTLEQNGVAERRNRTLMEMVRSMMSQRERRSAISDDFIVYVTENLSDTGELTDPLSYAQVISSPFVDKWREAMKDEMRSMEHNGVWELVELPEGFRPIGCKWVFKTKRDSKGNIDRYKARLVAKGYTQKEGIDYKETFFPISSKDAFRIVMALVAHFDLELHQMDVKTAFRNMSLLEEVYMVQPEGLKRLVKNI
ncbi:uncharacterized protein [Nicotiana sylvestris]|uniref:uncharacterized protein n=1 Tax=Nicotiana sylvestris TaxID=4096 RepID=UPI00388CD4C1